MEQSLVIGMFLKEPGEQMFGKSFACETENSDSDDIQGG